jgi:hypothetical protein
VIDRTHDLDFANKAFDVTGLAGQMRVQAFESDFPTLERAIAHEINGAHPASSERAQNLVALGNYRAGWQELEPAIVRH